MSTAPVSVPTVFVRPPQTSAEAIAAAGLAPDAAAIVVTVADFTRPRSKPRAERTTA